MKIDKIIDNYYKVLSDVKKELILRIEKIAKKDIVLYDTSKDIDDEYYELPTFPIIGKYEQYYTYSIVKVTKHSKVIGSGWEEGDEEILDLIELTTDTLYDLYIELTKGN